MFISPVAGTADSCRTLTLGEGFYGVQLVDIDGDGRDEIVRTNVTVGATSTSLSFSISGYDSNCHYHDYGGFSVPFDYRHVEGSFISPVQLYVDYGDFTGRGKIEALAVVGDPDNGGGATAIIDMETHDLCFYGTTNLPYGDTIISFCYDLDGDGKTEFCRAESSKLKIYRFNGAAFDSTSVYYFNKDLMSRCLTYGDVNGDGYFDAVIASADSNSFSCYYFSGSSFASQECITHWPIRPGDKFSLVDINSDGLQELARIRYANLSSQAFFCINDSYGIYRPYSLNKHIIKAFSSKAYIAPCNLTSYSGSGSIITIEEDGLNCYELNTDRGALRLMTSVTDSYGLRQENTFKDISNLAEDDDTFGIDATRSYDVSEGYCRLVPPIRVLAQTATYIPGCLAPLDSLRYRYRDAVFHQRGLGFRGFGETTVINSTRNTTDARLFTTTVYDPENSGVVLNVYKRLASENAEPFETTTNNWQKIFRPYAKHIPRLRASYTESPLTGFATSESYTYDNLDFVKTVSSEKTELGEWRRRHSQQSSSSEQAHSAVNSEENPSYLQVITTNTYSHLTDSNTGKYILGRITKCIEERCNDIESGEISWRGETVTTFQTPLRMRMVVMTPWE